MREWVEPQPVEVPEELREAVGGRLLVAQTLVHRGLTDVDAARAFLDPALYRPTPPTDLPNVELAAERLERAIQRGETICVWGDFDVDGQTATTLLVSTLKELGAAVRYHIPNRLRESHGVHLPKLQQLIAEGVSLVLTCDTGVTSHEPIAYAQAQGVDVLVTDHHDLPPTLPPAYAVVNPKMLAEGHPLRELPGVGCAFKLAEVLYERAGRPEGAAQYLDLVALGAVADVAVQAGDVRYLIQRGLEALRHTTRTGLQALMEVAELNPGWLTEEHIGFVLSPRLNALGRLADANAAVEFLMTGDLERARILATELEGLNARRKLLCNQVIQAAQSQIERDPTLLEYGALVLSHPSWPVGVLGIVAGRLAEQYGRPAILIATPSGELGRGSARSVEGYNITAALAAHWEMLESFGGHPMAAGLAIDPERVPEFRRLLSRTLLEVQGPPQPARPLQIDSILSLADLSLDLVEELERLAPFGPGNPPLVLASLGLALISHSSVGRDGEHLQLIVEDEQGTAQKVLWWQGASVPLPEGRFDLAYVARASDYRGQRAVQVEWVDARPVETPAAALHPERPTVEVVDYRGVTDPRQMLERLRAQEENVQVWSEAEARTAVAGHDRYALGPSRVLAIWTTPPGPAELRATLERASPYMVYLFGIDPGLDQPEQFLKRLAGLVRRALNADQGRVSIPTLAAATAQRESTVRAGLAWLAARGHVVILDVGAGLAPAPLAPADVGAGPAPAPTPTDVGARLARAQEVHLAAGDQTASADLLQIAAQLNALLEETAAYRTYFARTDKEKLASSMNCATIMPVGGHPIA